MKQGEIGGVLKELGYTTDQVAYFLSLLTRHYTQTWPAGVQVLIA